MGHKRFLEIANELVVLHDKKSKDYGSDLDPLGNINSATLLGLSPLQGVALRLQDKFSRLAAYLRNGSLNHEGINDTLRDMASYAINGLICLEEENRESLRIPEMSPLAIPSSCYGCGIKLPEDKLMKIYPTPDDKDPGYYYCSMCYDMLAEIITPNSTKGGEPHLMGKEEN